MTPNESREHYVESLFTMDEILYLKQIGLYQDYAAGLISVEEIYKELKDQAV